MARLGILLKEGSSMVLDTSYTETFTKGSSSEGRLYLRKLCLGMDCDFSNSIIYSLTLIELLLPYYLYRLRLILDEFPSISYKKDVLNPPLPFRFIYSSL